MTDELAHIKELAGIESNQSVVLLPKKFLNNTEETAELLAKLKKIDNSEGENWTTITTVDGTEYIATGVVCKK